MPGIGHNQGPSMDRGVSFRRYTWRKARADLLPVLPLPVIRMRVRRAAELGLDYKTYATVRATTGRDVVALLFSTNALRLFQANQALDAERHMKLKRIENCDRRAMTIAPLRPGDLNLDVLDAIGAAPSVHAAWTNARQVMATLKGPHPADAVLMVGDTSLERDWSTSARLAGYLSSDRFFSGAAS